MVVEGTSEWVPVVWTGHAWHRKGAACGQERTHGAGTSSLAAGVVSLHLSPFLDGPFDMRGRTWVDPEASSLPLSLGRRQGGSGHETLDSFVAQEGTAGEDRGGGGVIRTDTATIVLHHHYSTDEAYSHCTCEVCAL